MRRAHATDAWGPAASDQTLPHSPVSHRRPRTPPTGTLPLRGHVRALAGNDPCSPKVLRVARPGALHTCRFPGIARSRKRLMPKAAVSVYRQRSQAPAMVAPGACFRRSWRRLRCCWHAWPSRAASSLAPAVAVRAGMCGLFEVAPSTGCGCVQAVAWMHETRQQATSPDERLSGGAGQAGGRQLEELQRVTTSLKAGSHATFSQRVGSSSLRESAGEAVVRITDSPLEDQPVLLLSEVQRVDHLVMLEIESVRVDVLGVVEEIPPALPG